MSPATGKCAAATRTYLKRAFYAQRSGGAWSLTQHADPEFLAMYHHCKHLFVWQEAMRKLQLPEDPGLPTRPKRVRQWSAEDDISAERLFLIERNQVAFRHIAAGTLTWTDHLKHLTVDCPERGLTYLITASWPLLAGLAVFRTVRAMMRAGCK